MISIVIPVYNAEKQLVKCLSSVINQTYILWECLLVDDGSTDNSGSICEDWQMRDNRFRVFHQHNQGVSAARNKGISKSKGDYICFVDADDWIESCFLEIMVNHVRNADWVMSGQIREWSDKKTIHQPERTEIFPLDSNHTDTFVELCRCFLLYAPHEKIYRADIIRQHQLTFREGCQYGEDLMFNFQYLEHISEIATINTALYHYTMGTETLSTTFRSNQFDEDYDQWKILEKFFSTKGFTNRFAQEYLYQRLWGIVYDGIFLFPHLEHPERGYIRHILQIPEISKLKDFRDIFHCSSWIKSLILYRASVIFIMFFLLKQRK